MHPFTDMETDFGWTPTGAFLPTPRSERAARDRENGQGARWYHAALPPFPRDRSPQLGEPDPNPPRQLGEQEGGDDDARPSDRASPARVPGPRP